MRMSYSSLLRSMPVYQAQLNRTDFRSFASFAGVYGGAPRPRPPRPPPCACAPAGAAPVCCEKDEDGALIVRAMAMATVVPTIFRKPTMMIPPLIVRVTRRNLDHTSIRHDDGFEEAQRAAVLRRTELHFNDVSCVQRIRTGFADSSLRERCGRSERQHP